MRVSGQIAWAAVLLVGLAGALGQTGGQGSGGAATHPAENPALEAKVLLMMRSEALSREQLEQWFPEHVRQLDRGMQMTVLLTGKAPLEGVKDDVVISSVKDDQGRNLTGVSASLMRADYGAGGGRMMTPDGRGTLVTVTVKDVAAADAREVTIQGHLTLAQAGAGAMVVAKDVPLRLGEEVKAGTVTLRIAGVALRGQGLAINFRTAEREEIQDIEFLGARGEALTATRDPEGLESQMGMGGQQTAEKLVSYLVGGGLRESVTLRVKIIQGVVEAPFEAKVRVGL